MQPELTTNRLWPHAATVRSKSMVFRRTCCGVPWANNADRIQIAPDGDLRPEQATRRCSIDLMVQLQHVGARGGHIGQNRHRVAADVQ